MQATARVLISGMVQGIFFRSSIRGRARLYQLKGWVRNTQLGEVEAVFEGEKEQVEQMIDYCKSGPSGSQVEHVEVEWKEEQESFTDFEIR